MKRTFSVLLLLLMCVATCLPMTACGADQSGAWGAYYQAFSFFASNMKEDTAYLSLDFSGIQEEHQDPLYDLFLEYCEDTNRLLYKGGAQAFASNALINSETGFYKNAYAVKYTNIVWSKDEKSVTMTVSVNDCPYVSDTNLGGTVTVTATEDGWKVTPKNDIDIIRSSSKDGAYCTVIKDLLTRTDSMGPVANKYICLDPEGIENDCLPKVRRYVKALFGKQGFDYLEMDWEALKAKGYVESTTFTTGYQISFNEINWSSDEKSVEIMAWLTRGELNSGGCIYTLTLEKNSWVITDANEMIS